MEAALQDGTAAPHHRARIERLLRTGVEFRPLTPEFANEVGNFIADQFFEGGRLTIASGISAEEIRDEVRGLVLIRANNSDPLSVTAWVEGEVVAAFVCWDALEDNTSPSLRAVVSSSPGSEAIFRAMELADARVAEILDVQRTSSAAHSERWLEYMLEATSEPVRFFLPSADGRSPTSFAQAVRTFRTDDTAHCGVYTHINIHSHVRSFPHHVGAEAHAWRKRTGAPKRTAAWDVLLTIPYSELGLARAKPDGDAMFTGATQLRPAPTHAWA